MRESKVSTAPSRAHFLLYVARVPAGFLLEQIIKLVSYPKQNNSFGQSRVKRLVKVTNQNLNQTCAPGSKRWKCLKQLTIGQWFCVFGFFFMILSFCFWLVEKMTRGFLTNHKAWQCEIKAITKLSRKLIALECSLHKMGRIETGWGKKLFLEKVNKSFIFP